MKKEVNVYCCARPIIAIDGPAASGKGTLARLLAKHLNFAHLETGLLYRAVALKMIEQQIETLDLMVEIAQNLTLGDLESERLRADDVAKTASEVVAIDPKIRKTLLDFQHDFMNHPPHPYIGAILDGRDIGTVIAPTADFKFFVTAGLEERARRRYQELLQRGFTTAYEIVLEDLTSRDERDKNRPGAPLTAASDAIIINTDNKTIDQVFKEVLSWILLSSS